MRTFILIFLLSLITLSCNSVKEKTKEIINKSGETVGKAASEFIEGASEGIDQTLKCEITLSEELKKQGLSTGKYSITNDSTGGKDNQLTLYLIFEKDFDTILTAKAFDKEGLETGRTKLTVKGIAGNAQYFDFIFDKRMALEAKSKITIE